jgi:hypothetical protein
VEETRARLLVYQSEELRKRAHQLKEKWTTRSDSDGNTRKV